SSYHTILRIIILETARTFAVDAAAANDALKLAAASEHSGRRLEVNSLCTAVRCAATGRERRSFLRGGRCALPASAGSRRCPFCGARTPACRGLSRFPDWAS